MRLSSLHCSLALCAGFFSLSAAQAQETPLFFFDTPAPQARHAAPLPAGYQRVSFDGARLAALPSGTRTVLQGPGIAGTYEIEIEGVTLSAQGSRTLVGRLADHDERYRVIITQNDSTAFGRITTPEGIIHLEPHADGGLVLVHPDTAGLTTPPQGQCSLPPPLTPAIEASPISPSSTPTDPIPDLPPPSSMLGYRSGNSVVDVMLVYTDHFVSRLGGHSQAMARLDHLVALTNQAYADSGVAITLRDVHRTQVNYSTYSGNSATLDAITASSGVFSTLPGLRTQYGADFIALIRPFDRNTQGSCGVAWSGGYRGQAFTQRYAYSVSSDGDDVSGSRYYCDDVTFAHELGHNMGLAHNWGAGGAGEGRYYYGNGHGVPQSFGTVMSYIAPSLARFSNPNQTCNGVPCGVPEGQVQPADASRALNNVRTEIAAITPTASTVTPNQSPIVSAGNNQQVQASSLVRLSGSASDPDGSIASVQWQQTGGTTVTLNEANTLAPSFTAPSQSTTLSFQLTATDNQGATASSTVSVQVVAAANQPPIVSAGSNQQVQAGSSVRLSGSASDPDGSIASVQWQQTGGTAVTLSGANTLAPSFTAPAQSTTLSFQLTATDNQGASASSTVSVQVLASATVDPRTQRECFFGWAERTYPELFAGTAQTQQNGHFFSRHYSSQNNYLWVFTHNGQNQSLYFFGAASGFNFLDLGRFQDWATLSAC